jgi:hypothetical protein
MRLSRHRLRGRYRRAVAMQELDRTRLPVASFAFLIELAFGFLVVP